MNIKRSFTLLADHRCPAAAEPSGARGGARTLLELARYFVASAAALAVDVGLYRLGLQLDWSYLFAAPLGFCGGAVVAYAASVRWVFSARAVENAGLEFGLFVGVGVAGLLLTEVLLWLAIGRVGAPPLAAKLGTSGAVFVFNFVARKALLFSARGAGVTSPGVGRVSAAGQAQ